MQNRVCKPILKWAGGKTSLAPEIYKHFIKVKKINRYIEPFFGSGAFYFYLINKIKELSKKTIINDNNSDLIHLYKDIVKHNKKLIDSHEKIIRDYKDENKGYYYIRDKFNGLNKKQRYSKIERSAALMVLNKTCFNGLYRVNSKNNFNVPKGKYKNPSFVNAEQLKKIKKSLPPIEGILSTSYDEITYQKNDLIYFDPPYHPVNETSYFTSYSGIFGKEEQEKLSELFTKLDAEGKNVILSNSHTPFIRQLYKKHKHKLFTVDCSRSINAISSKRGKIKEYIIVGKNFG